MDSEGAASEANPTAAAAVTVLGTFEQGPPKPLPLEAPAAVRRSLALPGGLSLGGLVNSEHTLDPEILEPDPPATQKMSGPEVLVTAVPEYPRRARQMGIEGAVTLEVDVDLAGVPQAVRVISSSGRTDMDQAAKEAVLQWRFAPAASEAEPAVRKAVIVIAFRLTD